MATRIEKILSNARVTLADKNKERWSDEDLLAILDEGHKDLCRQSQVLTGRLDVTLTVGDPYFDIPDDVWMITRVVYEDRAIPLITHTQLDETTLAQYNIDFGSNFGSVAWESETGTPLALIYDRRNVGEGKVYPIPDDSITDSEYAFKRPLQNEYNLSSAYGVVGISEGDILANPAGVVEEWEDFDIDTVYGVTAFVDAFNLDSPASFDGDEVFGVTVGLDKYTSDSLYGVVTDMFDPRVKNELFSSAFGVISSINEVKSSLKIYYIKNPADLVNAQSDLETPYMFDTALKYYVVGHAFLNDLNEEYQAKGAQQLGFYEREVNIAEKTAERDSTRAANYKTTYRGAF